MSFGLDQMFSFVPCDDIRNKYVFTSTQGEKDFDHLPNKEWLYTIDLQCRTRAGVFLSRFPIDLEISRSGAEQLFFRLESIVARDQTNKDETFLIVRRKARQRQARR